MGEEADFVHVCECVSQVSSDSSGLIMTGTHTHTPGPPTAHKATVVNK